MTLRCVTRRSLGLATRRTTERALQEEARRDDLRRNDVDLRLRAAAGATRGLAELVCTARRDAGKARRTGSKRTGPTALFSPNKTYRPAGTLLFTSFLHSKRCESPHDAHNERQKIWRRQPGFSFIAA